MTIGALGESDPIKLLMGLLVEAADSTVVIVFRRETLDLSCP